MIVFDYANLSKNRAMQERLFSLIDDATLRKKAKLFDVVALSSYIYSWLFPFVMLLYLGVMNTFALQENFLTYLMQLAGAFWFVWLFLYFIFLYPLSLFLLNKKLNTTLQKRVLTNEALCVYYKELESVIPLKNEYKHHFDTMQQGG